MIKKHNKYLILESDSQDIIICGESKSVKKDKRCLDKRYNKFVENEIESGNWLSDETINLLQFFLCQRFPLTKGFEETTLGPQCMFSIQKGEFIQILHDRNHWVTVYAPSEGETDMVYLYDSLQKSTLSKGLAKQICSIRHLRRMNSR